MPPPKGAFNPIAGPGDYLTDPVHNDTYPAIDPMKAELKGKSVFISGASRGLGRAMTLSFAKAGASFIAVGARGDMTSLVQEIIDTASKAGRSQPKVLSIELDVTSRESIDDAATCVQKEFGRLDVLVNNAGVLSAMTSIADSDPDEWWQAWTVNVRGTYLVSRAFLPLMLKGGDKQIVNVCSVGAHVVNPGLSAYQTSKLAQLRFTEFLCAEYGDQGLIAFCIHPGNIPTDIVGGIEGVPENIRHVPTDLTIWDWLFDSPYSPLNSNGPIAGYTNATTGERIDYAQVKEFTTYLSTALARKYGFKEGDTVALFSPNTIWYPVAMFGVLRAGGVMSGASPAYNIEEMTYALKTAHAKFLMTVPSSMDVAMAAARNAGIPKERILLLEDSANGCTTMKQLLDIGRSYGDNNQLPAFKIPRGKQNKDICGLLSFSSGTTGLPKAVLSPPGPLKRISLTLLQVMISHQNVIAQSLQIAPITPSDHDKVLAVLPCFHITALNHALHLPVYLNAEVYMLPAFTMSDMLATTAKYKIKELLIVPPILIRLVRDPIVDQYDLSHLQRFSTGAAPISEEIIQLLQKKFPQTKFKQGKFSLVQLMHMVPANRRHAKGYGMTESCSCITAHPPEQYDYKYAHTVGTLIPCTEAKIIDLDGNELGHNEAGEVLARGPQVVMGYLDNPKATAETFDDDGWLHTGDQGFIDEQGLLTITDRIKEMIKVKGIGVAPAELEDLLLGHPKVEDTAVLGMPDDYSGERPKAFIVPKKGSAADEALARELVQYVKDCKVRHKWIKDVEFVEEIPKSASGKILRRVLRDKAKETARRKVYQDDAKEKAKL
ncbi:MAG: hypothetical protein Q9220_005852 [cf. Caloplaca sp. 1 TL-2023]